MSKSYPFIDILCDTCNDEIRIELDYHSEQDRWQRAGHKKPVVYFPGKYKGWKLIDGCDSKDYCPKCKKEPVVEETKAEEKKTESDGGTAGLVK